MQTKIQREKVLTTPQLIEHVKAVGQAIIDDADKIAFDTTDLSSIVIRAYINPGEEATTVTYRMVRYADPRFSLYDGKENNGRTEEEKAPD